MQLGAPPTARGSLLPVPCAKSRRAARHCRCRLPLHLRALVACVDPLAFLPGLLFFDIRNSRVKPSCWQAMKATTVALLLAVVALLGTALVGEPSARCSTVQNWVNWRPLQTCG